MDQHDAAEQYQEGRQYHYSQAGERSKNLQHAISCYENALQYYTFEVFPEKWEEIQQEMTAAYSELAQQRRKEAEKPLSPPMPVRRSYFTKSQRLVFALILLVILAIPTIAIAGKAYQAHSSPSCFSGMLTMDGSAVLQPWVQAVADDYKQHCPNAQISVGGGASKVGLADVEQGHNFVVSMQKDPWHITGRDVPVDIGDSDIFASPVQHDLVDHQVTIGVFVLILNKQVTGLHNLTTAQILRIYTGGYQNWKEVCDPQSKQCGPDLPIIPISRTTNSGTRFTFEKYVLSGVATVPGIGLERTYAAKNAVEEVESNPGSIGYAPLYMARNASDVTIVSIDGNDPHNSSLVQTNQYKFWNIEHMYTRGPASPFAQTFINYMYSDVAQKLLSQYALLPLTYVPQNIRDQRI